MQAKPAFEQFGTELVTSTNWNPSTDPDPLYDPIDNNDDSDAESSEQDRGRFGGLAFIYGSVVTSFLSMLLAVPLGVGTAAFLAEVATPAIKRAGSFLVELLAAIPSVVYGFWGINFLAPSVQHAFDQLGWSNQAGKGLLSASLILAIMIVPYVAAVSYDVCRSVPRSQREAALALGSTRWQMIWKVVLPYARPGIIGGCFLALGRAIGETMAVTMLIGNTPQIAVVWVGGFLPLPKLSAHGDSIPSVLANQLGGAETDRWRSALIALALLLFGVTIVMNVAARLLLWRVGRVRRGPSLLARIWPKKTVAAAGHRQSSHAAAHPASPLRAAFINRLMIGGEWSAVLTGLVTLAVLGTLAVVVVFTAGPVDASAPDARPILLSLVAGVGCVAVARHHGRAGALPGPHLHSALLDRRVHHVPRRRGPELGLLHQTARALRRAGRRPGQRPVGQRYARRPCDPFRRAGGNPGGHLPGGVPADAAGVGGAASSGNCSTACRRSW